MWSCKFNLASDFWIPLARLLSMNYSQHSSLYYMRSGCQKPFVLVKWKHLYWKIFSLSAQGKQPLWLPFCFSAHQATTEKGSTGTLKGKNLLPFKFVLRVEAFPEGRQNWQSCLSTWKCINPSFAEHDMPCLRKQCRSKEANWSGSALSVIKYVNFYQKPGSSNLTGWKLEVGVVSLFSMTRVNSP